jgi:hypothetical protein
VGPLPGDRNIRAGDIVVTAVTGTYAIGRLKTDAKTQEFLGSQQNRAQALQQACALAGVHHRVILYPSAGSSHYRLVDCAEVSKSAENGVSDEHPTRSSGDGN